MFIAEYLSPRLLGPEFLVNQSGFEGHEHVAGVRVTLRWLLGHRPANYRSTDRRDRRIVRPGVRDRTVALEAKKIPQGGSAERHQARQHLVVRSAQTVQIGARVQRQAPGLFGGEIGRSARDHARGGAARPVEG
jgi:hypothetical protein